MGGAIYDFVKIDKSNYVSLNYHKNENIYRIFTKDSIKIGVIGDSYALRQNYRRSLLHDICSDSLNMNVQLKSIGLGGRQSDSLAFHLSDRFTEIINWHPDYCVVFGGTNDVFLKGKRNAPDSYAHNMSEIARFLIAKGIKPIIAEIGPISLDRNRFQHYFIPSLFKESLIESYRKALADSLSKEDLKTEILILPYVSWAETRGDLFEDIVHPNDLGFIEIDKSIARIIKSDLKNIRNNK